MLPWILLLEFDLIYLKMEKYTWFYNVHKHLSNNTPLFFTFPLPFKSPFCVLVCSTTWGWTIRCSYKPLSLVLCYHKTVQNVDLSHAWHFKLSSFLLFFSRFVSSRNPQVADLYGFLLDHYLLHLHVSSFLMVLLFIHALLAFLPFLLKLFVIFKTQKCVLVFFFLFSLSLISFHPDDDDL